MKRRNILFSLVAFPTLAVANHLFISENSRESDEFYTLIFALDNNEENITIYHGTKEQIQEQLLRPYRLSYCKGRNFKFFMRQGSFNEDTIVAEIKELENYLQNPFPNARKLSGNFVTGTINQFDKLSVPFILDSTCGTL